MSIDTENTDPVTDLEPVELDPSDPAIARWEELADWDGIIYHDGDAEAMLPFPRPAWADVDEDDFGQSYISTCYSSRPARVAIKQAPGNRISANQWAPAAALVSAELYGTGITKVALTLTNIREGKWFSIALGLSPAEALELADVLKAAVDLLGGSQ
ncbi:hypothetical protein [Mycolicibacterium conceptionense]|uniref:hypothetical protein n=1 Tax=Mycolicibacterium conceptionense TaxID=451644 RepID=UPI0007ED505E|nr:hypothetical protein [Mycolicibacterium conceptionense]OBJ97574.1 hypothetical protein A5639_30225 [Mycolicibacterium conceptionense]